MTPFSSLSINFKKLTVKTRSAFFLIVPIALLISIGSVLSSQVHNFSTATDSAIFNTIANQSTVLQITKQNTQTGGGFGGDQGGGFRANRTFSSDDISVVNAIPHVMSSSVNYSLPINQIKTTDLVSNKTIDLTSLTVLTPEAASLYTKESFGYTEGSAVVPIILNANSLVENYEDWGGKDSITVTLPQRGQGRGQNNSGATNFRDQLPTKQQTIAVDKDSLIGKQFNISFGGLDSLTTFTSTFDGTSAIFTRSTEAEKAAKEADRLTSISKYWDYTKISTPVTYTFKVVGYIKSDTNRATYVPEQFTTALMQKLIQNQQAARTAAPLVITELGAVYRGITYNGSTLETAQATTNRGPGGIPGLGGGRGGQQNNTAQTAPATAYTIPGLVIQADANSNEIMGTFDDPAVFVTASKTSQNLTVKFDSIYNRDQVVRDLNTKGFAYVDTSNTKVFSDLQQTLKTASFWIIIGFIALIVIILGFNMAKTITEARREVGIFRALGFTKMDIISIFTTQGVLYTLIGALAGVGLAVLINAMIAPVVLSKFTNLVSSTIQQSYGILPDISLSQFQMFDWNNLGILSALLLAVAIVISFMFSLRASNISPVEAIKAE
jgi:ABC-type antimicrobial peptide transport system permease subunit